MRTFECSVDDESPMMLKWDERQHVREIYCCPKQYTFLDGKLACLSACTPRGHIINFFAQSGICKLESESRYQGSSS